VPAAGPPWLLRFLGRPVSGKPRPSFGTNKPEFVLSGIAPGEHDSLVPIRGCTVSEEWER
jgi:hypothetical protein